MRRILRDIDQDTGVIVMETHRLNGRLHRAPSEGPAYILRERGTVFERYYWKGRLHRENGPAWIHYDEDTGVRFVEDYYRHGLSHRDPDDGPSLVVRSDDGRVIMEEAYCFNDKLYRDPAIGPCYIGRDRSGRINRQDYSTADEVFAMRRPKRRTANVKIIAPSP
jgi:hypothetical protein